MGILIGALVASIGLATALSIYLIDSRELSNSVTDIIKWWNFRQDDQYDPVDHQYFHYGYDKYCDNIHSHFINDHIGYNDNNDNDYNNSTLYA